MTSARFRNSKRPTLRNTMAGSRSLPTPTYRMKVATVASVGRPKERKAWIARWNPESLLPGQQLDGADPLHGLVEEHVPLVGQLVLLNLQLLHVVAHPLDGEHVEHQDAEAKKERGAQREIEQDHAHHDLDRHDGEEAQEERDLQHRLAVDRRVVDDLPFRVFPPLPAGDQRQLAKHHGIQRARRHHRDLELIALRLLREDARQGHEHEEGRGQHVSPLHRDVPLHHLHHARNEDGHCDIQDDAGPDQGHGDPKARAQHPEDGPLEVRLPPLRARVLPLFRPQGLQPPRTLVGLSEEQFRSFAPVGLKEQTLACRLETSSPSPDLPEHWHDPQEHHIGEPGSLSEEEKSEWTASHHQFKHEATLRTCSGGIGRASSVISAAALFELIQYRSDSPQLAKQRLLKGDEAPQSAEKRAQSRCSDAVRLALLAGPSRKF
eukprot:scaffold2660_cov257-Pinguiococcus_pyrenoidosus.AAC.24